MGDFFVLVFLNYLISFFKTNYLTKTIKYVILFLSLEEEANEQKNCFRDNVEQKTKGKNMKITKVRCEQDGAEFKPAIKTRKSPTRWDNKTVCIDQRVINCPVCGRGYVENEDGVFVSDRVLTIIN